MDSNYENMNLFDFLRLICNKLAQFCKWIFGVVLALVHLCFCYWYIMLACIVLGFFGARLWIKPQFTRFSGQATLTFLPGMKPVVEEGLLSFMSQSFETKRDVFELPDSTQLAIRGLNTYNVVDSKSDGSADFIDKNGSTEADDTLNSIMQDRLTVRIKLQGCPEYWPLENALLIWFNSQEKFTKPDSIYREQLGKRLEYLNHEIARSDSFLDHRYFGDVPKVQIYNDIEVEQRSEMMYTEMLELIRERDYIESELRNNPRVVNFQTHFYIDSMIPKQKYIIGLCVGFALGVIVSLIVRYWTAVKEFICRK